ncbi:MAG TPA: hypothetical protein VIF62_23395 [Labilithrix sp.]|jgi:hypothetical protein
MKQPYRAPADRDEKKKNASTLVVTTDEAERHVGPARRFLQVFLVSSLLGSGLVMSGWGVAGVAVGVGGFAWAIARARKKQPQSGHELEVRNEAVDLRVRGVSIAHIALAKLDDVRLDTKTFRRGSGVGAASDLEFHGKRDAMEASLARIVLVDHHERETALGEEWLAHVDAIEWLGKIRKFLRAHGWVPADERQEDSGDA